MNWCLKTSHNKSDGNSHGLMFKLQQLIMQTWTSLTGPSKGCGTQVTVRPCGPLGFLKYNITDYPCESHDRYHICNLCVCCHTIPILNNDHVAITTLAFTHSDKKTILCSIFRFILQQCHGWQLIALFMLIF